MRAFILLLVFTVAASSVHAAAPDDRIAFTVPVSVSHLHRDLSMVRARCAVFADRDWRSGRNVIGQGASQPYATQAEGGERAFLGDLDVPVFLTRGGKDSARSYACALELYNAATQEWADAETVAQHYPIDRAARAVTSIGGPLE